jgi:hypothetical protein
VKELSGSVGSFKNIISNANMTLGVKVQAMRDITRIGRGQVVSQLDLQLSLTEIWTLIKRDSSYISCLSFILGP